MSLRRLEVAYWLLAAVLGLAHVWADPHSMVSPDGMSYVDVAETYLRGDWRAAINAYWSPMYSWLIALAFAMVEPAPAWKFAVVHVVNLAMYLCALGCFAFLIRELVHDHRLRQHELEASRVSMLPDWGLTGLGYAFFIWSSLYVITIRQESPDLLVAAIVYAAAGMLLRIRRHPGGWLWFAMLGVAMGFGYLTKTVMAPLAAVFLGVAALLTWSLRRAVPRVALAGVMFLALAGPFMFAISQAKGRPTFGDSGRLNYLWSINDVSEFHWQGEQEGHGTPAHPTRQVSASPPIYEFTFPAGSYPPWYDPTYWFEGSVSRFDAGRQLIVLAQGAQIYYGILHRHGVQYAMLVGLLTLCLLGRSGQSFSRELTSHWALLTPALAGLAVYSMIWVNGRYVAPFLTLVWLTLFLSVRLPSEAARVMRTVTLVVVALVTFTAVASGAEELTVTARSLIRGENRSNDPHLKVAESLRRSGVARGARVAVIGIGWHGYWANLAGVQIIAELPAERADTFWQADAARRDEILQIFEHLGVSGIVAEKPAGVVLSGWTRVEDTDFYVYRPKDL